MYTPPSQTVRSSFETFVRTPDRMLFRCGDNVLHVDENKMLHGTPDRYDELLSMYGVAFFSPTIDYVNQYCLHGKHLTSKRDVHTTRAYMYEASFDISSLPNTNEANIQRLITEYYATNTEKKIRAFEKSSTNNWQRQSVDSVADYAFFKWLSNRVDSNGVISGKEVILFLKDRQGLIQTKYLLHSDDILKIYDWQMETGDKLKI